MMLFFSGTGNTRLAARYLARKLGETTCVELLRSKSPVCLRAEEPLGLLFPIYAWGIPRVFRDALEQLEVASPPPYIYGVCTCGDEIGTTAQELRALLQAKGLRLDAVASVQMPETYVAFPGFHLDTQAVALRKLQAARRRLDDLSTRIGRRETFTDVRPGTAPWMLSHVVNPLFYACLISDRHYHASRACTGCGRCVQACPVGNIRLVNGRPAWQGHCAGCLACYHHCPAAAIRYGRRTQGKGQYQPERLMRELRTANDKKRL